MGSQTKKNVSIVKKRCYKNGYHYYYYYYNYYYYYYCDYYYVHYYYCFLIGIVPLKQFTDVNIKNGTKEEILRVIHI